MTIAEFNYRLERLTMISLEKYIREIRTKQAEIMRLCPDLDFNELKSINPEFADLCEQEGYAITMLAASRAKLEKMPRE